MDASPLKRLPGEVLNEIYKLALIHDQPIVISEVEGKIVAAGAALTMALTTVCRQIRKESLGFFYAVNLFQVKTHYLEDCYKELVEDEFDSGPSEISSLAGAWLEIIGDVHTKQLKKLCVDLGSFTIDELFCIDGEVVNLAVREITALPVQVSVLHSSIAYAFMEMPFEAVHLELKFCHVPIADKTTAESIISATSVNAKANIPIDCDRVGYESAIQGLSQNFLDVIDLVDTEGHLEQWTLE